MDNTSDKTHLVDAHEEHIREDTKEEEIFYDVNENTIFEEEVENIHPDLDHNLTSPIMRSGLITFHQNYPNNFIDKPEDLCHY